MQKDVWRIALNPEKTKVKNMAPKGEGIPILVGDIIKVGRIKFKVREMKMQKLEGTFSDDSEEMHNRS